MAGHPEPVGPVVRPVENANNPAKATVQKEGKQFESFYHDSPSLICELKAAFKNLHPFIFLGGSEYVGRK